MPSPFYILLMMLSGYVNGEIYNTTRLEQVVIFPTSEEQVCLRTLTSLSPSTASSSSFPSASGAQVVARLMVESTAIDQQFTAGNATIDGLIPLTWYKVTLKHAINNYVHVLSVTMGNQSIPFKKSTKVRWTSSFIFKEILLFVKGVVEITNCETTERSTTPPAYPLTTTTAIKDTSQGTPTTTSLEDLPTINATLVPESNGETPSTTKETPTTIKMTLSPYESTTPKSGPEDKNPVPTKADLEVEDDASKVNLGNSNLPVIIGVVVSLFVLVSIALLLLCFCKKKKSQDRNSFKPNGANTVLTNRNEYKSVPIENKDGKVALV